MARCKLPMQEDPKQLDTVQASLKSYLESRAPETSFLISQLLGGLWTALSQSLITWVLGEGEIALSNINVIDNESTHCI